MRINSLDGFLPFKPMKEDSDFFWYRIDNKQDAEFLLSKYPDLDDKTWNFEFCIGSKLCIEPMEKIGDLQTYRLHWAGQMLDQIQWFCKQLGYDCIFKQTEEDKKLITYDEEPIDEY